MRTGRRGNPEAWLGRALLAHARAFGCEAAIVGSRSRSWSSATFTGERVTVTASGGAGFDQWLGSLTDASLQVRGHYVAELLVTERADSTAMLEALLIEDA